MAPSNLFLLCLSLQFLPCTCWSVPQPVFPLPFVVWAGAGTIRCIPAKRLGKPSQVPVPPRLYPAFPDWMLNDDPSRVPLECTPGFIVLFHEFSGGLAFVLCGEPYHLQHLHSLCHFDVDFIMKSGKWFCFVFF